jgi:hypothetical protein
MRESRHRLNPPSFGEALMMVAALILPWAVIGAVFRSNVKLGFYAGFSVGTICLLVVKPKQISTWEIIAFYGAVLLVHAILGPDFIH